MPQKEASARKGPSRIQQEKRAAIQEGALEVFSRHGFRGATIDQIAAEAKISKPNLLYYYASKEAIHVELLTKLLATWLDPLRALNPEGDPVGEVLQYARRKLEISQKQPRESRLFANEIIQGAPRILPAIEGELRELVDNWAILIDGWVEQGRIRAIDPYHLIFSIWALTQHYADFDIQVSTVLADKADRRFDDAETFLTTLYTRLLKP